MVSMVLFFATLPGIFENDIEKSSIDEFLHIFWIIGVKKPIHDFSSPKSVLQRITWIYQLQDRIDHIWGCKDSFVQGFSLKFSYIA